MQVNYKGLIRNTKVHWNASDLEYEKARIKDIKDVM